MTPIDPANFLHSLAIFMAAGTGNLAYTSGSPRAMWIFQAVEQAGGVAVKSADPYSVLSIYGGPAAAFDAQPRFAVQCMTFGTARPAAMVRAQGLYETLLDTDGYPIRMAQIAAKKLDGTADGHYRLVSVDPAGRPGVIGVDERNMVQVAFNFDVGFFKEA